MDWNFSQRRSFSNDKSGNLPPEWVETMERNEWKLSNGISGNHQTEWVETFGRNTHVKRNVSPSRESAMISQTLGRLQNR
jgi:hypothetical protein